MARGEISKKGAGEMRNIFAPLMVLALLLGTGTAVFAQGEAGASDAESILFLKIPMVITPAKKPVPISQSPTDVYVVTQEDIKQSGSVHLWDALREVPGLDVNTSTEGQADVSMRGFGDITSNKTLLMVDGRSMYNAVQGIQLWNVIPLQPEEIERIEVVKGPVASLYGANANLGLINIITKSPKEAQGFTFSSTGGTRDTNVQSLVYGGKLSKDTFYKFSGGWQETGSFDPRDAHDALAMASANLETEHQLSDNSKVSFSGGASHGRFSFLTTSTNAADQWYYGPVDILYTYLQSNYESGGFRARLYWNHWKDSYLTSKNLSGLKLDTVNSEISQAFDVGDKHSLLVGCGGSIDIADSNLFPSDNHKHSQAVGDIFAQDEYKIFEKLSLVGSARVDHYSLSGLNPSTHLAAIYTPEKNQIFRASVGSSFRSPTLSDYYLNYVIQPTAFPLDVTARGSKELDPEHYVTVEMDYEGYYLDHRLKTTADVFWTKIDGFIDAYVTGGGPLLSDASFRNQGKAFSAGGELGAEYQVSNCLALIANYAYNNVDYPANDEPLRYFSPKDKVNWGFKFKGLKNKLSAKFLAHYASATESTVLGEGKSKSYILANLWVGYKVNDHVELSVSGYNLVDGDHVEMKGGDKIGTKVLGRLDIKF
jgi:iron complex outermembrane recepter protein